METIVRIPKENEDEDEATKDMILFPKLTTFEIVDLPLLTSLCPEGSTFLWSSTKDMRVVDCEKLKTLCAVIPQRKKLENKSEMDSTSHDFSTSPTRSSNWCPAGCGCTPYSRPYAHRSIEILPRPINLEVTQPNHEDSNDDDNLENLTVSDCDSMEVIFQLKGPKHEESSHSVEAFKKLRSLQLYKLPSLTRIWETDSSQPMLTGSSFGNLKSLEVDCCNQLKYLFSSSMVKLLVSVEDIKVKNCEQMEEIVAADEETAEIITLPKVKSIKLESLPKLKYFCGEAYTLKLPSLELSGFQGFQNLRCLNLEACSGLKYVFSHLIAWKLLNLEMVMISGCPDMETIVRNTEENEEEATKDMILLPKVHSFYLLDLPRLTSLCPEGFTFLRSSTEDMLVAKCENLKTLGAVIPQRKKLENKSEKDSTSHDFSTSPTRSSNWWPAGCGCTPYSRPNAHRSIEILPRPINLEVTPTNLEDSNDDDNLENLTVHDCNSMEVIFQLKGPKHEESSHSFEAFNKLRSLQLNILPSLTRVWETGSSQPMLTGRSFGNLKSLGVYSCNKLKYLFSSSIVKLLVSVEDIKVYDCEQMEEIVAAEEETAEIITLPKVKSITLIRLPKLKYFCGEAYTLKLPSLELLEVMEVQSLRLFAPKHVDTHPRLQVRTELGVAKWMGDLNATLSLRKGEDDEINREGEHN